MSELIKREVDFGVVALNGVPVASSRKVAKVFNKRHDTVLRAIENAECSEEFRDRNFVVSFYRSGKGKYKEYLLTKDGFAFIVMGFTGKKAAKFKEAYIHRFNEMERFIESRHIARLESRELTDSIQFLHDPAKHYHYSNEFDMINRIVLGMPSKQFRIKHGIPKGEPIRDYLSAQQIDTIQKMQSFDAHLAKVMPDYKQRKKLLLDYYERITTPKICGKTG